MRTRGLHEDSQKSKKDSIQKHFYLWGIHKKTGKYARAIAHLNNNNNSIGKEYSDKAPKTSNRTIDLSKVDFTYKLQFPKANGQQDDSKIDEEDKIRESSDNIDNKALLPREIKNVIQLVPLLEKYTVSIDGDYLGYSDVVNRINAIDAQLGEHNNGDLEINWYDVLDIFLQFKFNINPSMKEELLLMYFMKNILILL